MSVIAFIPVRGGSKSIESKNIKAFCGKPLVYWTAMACQESDSVNKLVIATDDNEIKTTVLGFGFDKLEVFDRNDINATDIASTESVMLEYLSLRQHQADDQFVLIQATSPLTNSIHIDKAVLLSQTDEFDSVLSATLSKRFFWDKEGRSINYDYKSRPRRQDFEGVFLENGAIYINLIGNILKDRNRLSGRIGVFQMGDETSIEIDEPEDWIVAERQMRKYHPYFSKKKSSEIKIVLTDVDGVLTDASMYYTEKGDEIKRFNTYDGMAFSMLRDNGIKGGLITKENTKLVKRRAKKLNLDYEYSGIDDKLAILDEICQQEKIEYSNVAYIGDDVNDIPVLSVVGLAACPSNAQFEVKSLSNILQLETKGGSGVIREFIKHII
ncbi:acylneuraminate cytidylyltransferase [Reichenbachiella versicolor]|uniref:acylneuraminate cytidylyltransferase n=1 Tax=Reichenbachiella versicolor TaxID=1821036 RepID=UPI000D6DE343|nr:acylneuraminate cytidylyltransferase [Reichenbachiella versicolor]